MSETGTTAEPSTAAAASVASVASVAASDAAKTSRATTTPSESDVYDRQIRLWGAEAQKKMQNSRVLYVHVTGGSSEVLKNLCLAGIKASLCDPRPASVLDRAPCFFTPPTTTTAASSEARSSDAEKEAETEAETDQQQQQQQQQQQGPYPSNKKARPCSVAEAVKPLVEELNPLLGECAILNKEVSELTNDDLAGFSVVVASQIPLAEAVRLSELAHDAAGGGCIFYTIDCFGMRGAATIDFGRSDFEYRPEMGKKLLDPIPIKDYVSLSDMVKVPLKLATNRFHKHSPPPTWIMYRALMDHHASTGTWMGDEGTSESTSTSETDRATVTKFLEAEQVALTVSDLDDLLTAGMAQVPPVCAVLGGMVGNEVIKVISGKGEPANNTLLLDGGACKAWTFLVKANEKAK